MDASGLIGRYCKRSNSVGPKLEIVAAGKDPGGDPWIVLLHPTGDTSLEQLASVRISLDATP